MISVMASLFLVALDQTIISTALGKIVEDFNAFSSLTWVVTAYLITTTITTPIAGKLSDLFGRRNVILTGVTIFTLGSLLSGTSGDINQLILWRAFQGIGGGIILSPLLLLLKWTDMKQTAAISALFIFVNSFSGLAGQLTKGITFSPDMYGYVAVAFVGGICGAYYGSLKFKQNILSYMLAIVLMVAAYKLLFTNA